MCALPLEMEKPGDISFTSDMPDFTLPAPELLEQWLHAVAAHYGRVIGQLSYTFCTDETLLRMNQRYLGHDAYTDVIAFDCSVPLAGGSKEGLPTLGDPAMQPFSPASPALPGELSGDIYISIDRVRANSLLFHASWQEELCRVMVHGLLHLAGYKDKRTEEAAEMRQQEELALQRPELAWLLDRREAARQA